MNPKIVEGRSEAIMALMEFATLADVERFYNSPETQRQNNFVLLQPQVQLSWQRGCHNRKSNDLIENNEVHFKMIH
jgi:hypothetical protein